MTTTIQHEHLTPEELYLKYEHIGEKTVYSLFPSPHNLCKKANIELEDLFQYAKTGLWKAALKFDHTKGKRTFKNYAIKYIRWEILYRLNKDTRNISGTTEQADKFRKSIKYVSFDDTPKNDSEESMTFHELVGDDYNLEGNAIGNVLMEWVCDKNHDRVKKMIHLKTMGMTLEEIGNEFGLSKERVRQLLKKVKLQLNGVK